MSGHCEHCIDDCIGEPGESHYRLSENQRYEAWWDGGKCPMCAASKAERERIVDTLEEHADDLEVWPLNDCAAPPGWVSAEYVMGMRDAVLLATVDKVGEQS